MNLLPLIILLASALILLCLIVWVAFIVTGRHSYESPTERKAIEMYKYLPKAGSAKQICVGFILFLLVAMTGKAQDSTRVDTVIAELRITNSKLNSLQSVPGYVLIKNGCVVGYLSRNKKEFPRKVKVWYYATN